MCLALNKSQLDNLAGTIWKSPRATASSNVLEFIPMSRPPLLACIAP